MGVRRASGIIGITCGDPAGIGPEIIDSALASGRLDLRFDYRCLGDRSSAIPGQPTEETATAAREALEEAARLVLAEEIDAVVTGPVHKARLQAIGFAFPGQTEFFAARARIDNYAMCLTGGALTVALVTAHVPLKEVSALLSASEIVRVGTLLASFVLQRRLREREDDNPPAELLLDPDRFAAWLEERQIKGPQIAVAGLNPHAGESGALGREEVEIIRPAVEVLERRHPALARFDGPLSPDTVFCRAAAGEFDAVLCMYHDQGLIPLKLHAFDQGVNVTLGLPFPRTSPDHGTAFEIAGKNRARPESMIAAINLAAELAWEKVNPRDS